MGQRVVLKGRLSGVEIEINGTEILSDDEMVIEKIYEHAESLERHGAGIGIQGFHFPGKGLLNSTLGIYVLINDIEPMDVIEGEDPFYNFVKKIKEE